MSWALTNILDAFFLPPINLMICQIIAILGWRRWPRLSRALLVVSLALMAFFSIPSVSMRLLSLIEARYAPLNLSDPSLGQQAQAIVVLGSGREIAAPEYGGKDTVSRGGLERLRYAAVLYRRTHQPVLVTGGMPDGGTLSEGEVMRLSMTGDFGTPVTWVESASKNTRGNAERSFEILSHVGIKRIFLVTHAAHMLRARQAFEKVGFEVVPAPMGFDGYHGHSTAVSWVPSVRGLEYSLILLHESLGLVWYAVGGGR